MTKTSNKTVFHVCIRPNTGTRAIKKLLKTELAGNIYGISEQSTAVTVDKNGLKKLYEAEGDTGLIYLQIDDQKKQVPVLIDEVQLHPVTGEPQHVVFRRVNLKETLTAEVPIELVGEVEAPGLTVVQVRNSLEVRALPTDFPESFEVDISALKEAGDAIIIADLSFDKSEVEIIFTGDMDETAPIVLLQEIVEEEEEVDEEPPETIITTEKSDDEAAPEGEESSESAE